MTRTRLLDFVIQHLPSRQDAYLVFSACVFPIHFWMTFVLLYNLRSIILKANFLQTIGVFSYSFALAFFESVLLFCFLIILCFILPGRLFRERFVYLGTSLALVIPGVALITNTPELMNRTWLIFLLSIGIFAYLIYIITRPRDRVKKSTVAERLTVISSLYIFLDVIFFIYIIRLLVL